jgi:ribosomal protein S18 acetylase RimI-like enzyme
MTEVSIHPFARAHLGGLIRLVAAEGWAEYADDPERTNRALCSQGVTTLVALAGEEVIGVIQVQSDGVIQAHVSMFLIAPEWRGHGIGSVSGPWPPIDRCCLQTAASRPKHYSDSPAASRAWSS